MEMVRAKLVALLIAVAVFSGQICQAADSDGKKFVAFCSTTQIADFTRQIVGDRWEVQCVLAPGQDPHLYEPTTNDTAAARKADLCLQNGLHLEGGNWMETLARTADKKLVACTDRVEPLIITEGEEQLKVQDPHAWFTPHNAVIYVQNITKAVCEADPDNASEYEARAELYTRQLGALHVWIQSRFNAIPVEQRILVTSHDAFNYFCKAYGFTSAAPVGWSTGQEVGGDVTFARMKETVDSIKKFGVKAIFVETSVNRTLIEEIAKQANVKIGGTLYSDSMGAAGSAGETYIGMMRENVLKISAALK